MLKNLKKGKKNRRKRIMARMMKPILHHKRSQVYLTKQRIIQEVDFQKEEECVIKKKHMRKPKRNTGLTLTDMPQKDKLCKQHQTFMVRVLAAFKPSL